MLKIFHKIAVSVVTCKSFSKLKLIKNYVRSKNLAEQQLTEEINLDIVIEEFANKEARKVAVWKNVVFISEIKMVLIFILFYYFSCVSVLLFV